MLTDFASKWYALYYPLLGLIFLFTGIGLMVKTTALYEYLHSQSNNDQPPPLLRAILKYFFLFTIPCLLLSFFPFSWVELLFSLWSLVIVYAAGIQLVRWPQTRQFIVQYPDKMHTVIFRTGAIMLAVSPVMFLLSYLVIRKLVT